MKLELLFNLFNPIHQTRIIKFIKKFEIQYCIDVGAHKGEFLDYVLKIKDIKVFYSFEPQTDIFAFLKNKYCSNKNIYLYNCALDKEVSKKIIYINKLSSTSTLSDFNPNSFYLIFKNILTGSKNNFINKYEVETNTIDNLFDAISLNNCLIKIDVEGFEINVLRGGYKKLKEIPFVLIENQFGNHYKNSNFKLVEEFLKERNFKILKKFTFPTLHIQDILFKNYF